MQARAFIIGPYEDAPDPREQRLVDGVKYGVWAGGQFTGMIKRHIAFKQKYPDRPAIHGKPYEGIENLRPESKKIVEFFYLACHKNRALTRTEPRAGRIANYDR